MKLIIATEYKKKYLVPLEHKEPIAGRSLG